MSGRVTTRRPVRHGAEPALIALALAAALR
jgi:hypothetical protein